MIFVVRQVVEKAQECQSDLLMLFMDLKKAV